MSGQLRPETWKLGTDERTESEQLMGSAEWVSGCGGGWVGVGACFTATNALSATGALTVNERVELRRSWRAKTQRSAPVGRLRLAPRSRVTCAMHVGSARGCCCLALREWAFKTEKWQSRDGGRYGFVRRDGASRNLWQGGAAWVCDEMDGVCRWTGLAEWLSERGVVSD